MWAGSSALLRLFFPSFIRFLLLLIQLQNTVDIGLGRQQLFHFLTGFSVVGVGRFLLRQQLGVLGIQRLDGGQLLEAQSIKIVLCGLVDRDLAFMLCKKFLGLPCLAIGNVGIAGLGITHDMLPQHGNLGHALFRSLDPCGKLVKVSGRCRRFLRENGVI